jgi:sugar phosphate isomerase/epimerase
VKIAFSTLACPAWSLERVIEAAREYGYEGVELRLVDGELIHAGMPHAERDRVRKAFAASNLPIVAVDTSIQIATDEPVAAIGGLRARQVLGEAAGAAEKLGVTLALETHDHFSSSTRVAEVLDGLPPAAAALWDVAHPYRMGQNCEAVLAALDGRIAHVHVKDARRDGSPALLGEGDLPVKSCVEGLLKAGYAGWFSVEWEKRWHPELAEPEVALPHFAAILRSWKLAR